MEHVFAKTLIIIEVTELFAQKYKLTMNEARDLFYSSKTIELLDDDETGLYGQSGLYVFSLFEEEYHKSQ